MTTKTPDDQRRTELEAREERLNQEIEGIEEEILQVRDQVDEIASELDTYIPDSMAGEAKESVDAFAALIKHVATDLLLLARLHAIRQDPKRSQTPTKRSGDAPTLTWDDLPDPDAPSETDDPYDERIAVLKERVSDCVEHIHKLVQYADEVLEAATEAAHAGDVEVATSEVEKLEPLGEAADPAYKMWEACLSQLYEASPSSLGHTGDMLLEMEKAIRNASAPGPQTDLVRYFVVTEESGPAWDHARPMNQQEGWPDHAAFMNRLDDEGFVVLGGPLSADRHTALLIVDAKNEDAVHARLAPDPWIAKGLLRVSKVVAWQILLGGKHTD